MRAGGVDLQVQDAQDRVLDLMAAADQRPQAGQQFFQLKGFGQIIVGTEVEALDLVFGGVLGGQNEHMGFYARLAPFLEDRQAIYFGQHQIEDDCVVVGRAALIFADFAIFGSIDGKTLLFQTPLEGLEERLVIFDQENPHAFDSPAATPTRSDGSHEVYTNRIKVK